MLFTSLGVLGIPIDKNRSVLGVQGVTMKKEKKKISTIERAQKRRKDGARYRLSLSRVLVISALRL